MTQIHDEMIAVTAHALKPFLTEEVRKRAVAELSRTIEDILKRVEIMAPQSGMVQNLKVHTIGGVIRQGDVIMEIVPLNEPLNVQARVSPIDINHVLPSLDAEVRFPGFKSRTTPSMRRASIR